MSEQPVYVVAVSGGVDSVVLLDMLVSGRVESVQIVDPTKQLVVAHFEHGIREDSASDGEWVQALAAHYNLQFEIGHGKLGPNASEEVARDLRYNFLRQVCKKYDAVGIVTAHHQDDVVETAIINLLRGTGWRGLVSLGSGNEIIRPLLSTPKAEVLSYANQHKLHWREDSTNNDESYLRNYVRLTLLPNMMARDSEFTQELLSKITAIQELSQQISEELAGYVSADFQLARYNTIMWPTEVSREVIYWHLRNLDPSWHPTKLHIVRALHFAKTALPGKELVISKHLKLVASKSSVQFKKI